MGLNFRACLRIEGPLLLLHCCDEVKHIFCSILGTYELDHIWVAILKEIYYGLIDLFQQPPAK